MNGLRKVAGIVLFVLYIIVLVDVLFLMRGTRLPLSVILSRIQNGRYFSLLQSYANSAVNLVPFKTIRGYLEMLRRYGINGGNRIWWRNLVGNLFLFSPMGYLLPALFPRFRSFFKTLCFTALLVACVEALQLLTFSGSCDIDDLILNVTGCAFGYFVYKLLPGL